MVTGMAAVLTLSGAVAAAADAPPPLLPFYPQAGVIGQDLYFTNHVDVDPGPGVRDFACGSDTYDGHSGQDSGIRSFREVELGVPLVVRLEGTNVQQGKDILANSGLPIVSADDLGDAARKIVAEVKAAA